MLREFRHSDRVFGHFSDWTTQPRSCARGSDSEEDRSGPTPEALNVALLMPVKERERVLGVSRMVFHLQSRVYWPGLRQDVRPYLASCTDCLARMSPCPRRAPMGHVAVGHRWDRVAMDLLDMSVTSAKGNRYVLVMVNCFPDGRRRVRCRTRPRCLWRICLPTYCMPFRNAYVDTFGSGSGIRESDGLVERFNRTLLIMLAMFAGENRDDWNDLLPAVMMAYRSSVHESTGFSPYRLMFGEECTLPMDIGLPRQDPDLPDTVSSPYAVWVRDALEVVFDQVRRHSGQAVQRQKRLYDQRMVRRLFAIGEWVMCYYPPAKKCKLDSVWVGPYLVMSLVGWALDIQKHPDSPILLVHCQDLKKVLQPSGMMSWIKTPEPVGAPTIPVLGASTVAHSSQGFSLYRCPTSG